MGLTFSYRRFVKSFAQVAEPLHALTRKGVSFAWDESCQAAFNELKKRLSEAPILAYPKNIPWKPTPVSKESVLYSQHQDDRRLHPVAYASRAGNPTEQNYSITDLETLAVVWAIAHFRAYLYGKRVKIITNHAAVKAVLQSSNKSGRHARWWTKVHSSGMKEVHIIYRAGKENAIADALSRNPHNPGRHHPVRDPSCKDCWIGRGRGRPRYIASPTV